MNQIKYVLDACLIVVMIAMAAYLYTSFESTGTAGTDLDSKPLTVQADSKAGRVSRQHCGACHSLDKVLVGPALRNVGTRGPWNDETSLKNWLKDPLAFADTSRYARELMKVYGQPMPSFAHLNEEDLEAVIGFITE